MENTNETSPPKSIGECRIRTLLHLGEVTTEGIIKQKTAALINICDDLKPKPELGEKIFPEKLRYIALAQTAYEEASMWAVKAATF